MTPLAARSCKIMRVGILVSVVAVLRNVNPHLICHEIFVGLTRGSVNAWSCR